MTKHKFIIEVNCPEDANYKQLALTLENLIRDIQPYTMFDFENAKVHTAPKEPKEYVKVKTTPKEKQRPRSTYSGHDIMKAYKQAFEDIKKLIKENMGEGEIKEETLLQISRYEQEYFG